MNDNDTRFCSACGEPKPRVRHRTVCHECNLKRKRGIAARKQSSDAGAANNRNKSAEYRATPRGRAVALVFFAERRAKLLGLEFSVSRDAVEASIAAGFCVATGLPFDLSPATTGKHRTNPWAPSLDRRDNLKGYTAENVQVVCAAYNYAKNEFPEVVLVKLARAIVDSPRRQRLYVAFSNTGAPT